MKLKFAVVFEQTHNNFSAYPPDLPGCISTGETREDIREVIREAIGLHVQSMLEFGEPIPELRMSLEEALSYHRQSLTDFSGALTEFGDDVPTLSTTVEMVEVDVALQPA